MDLVVIIVVVLSSEVKTADSTTVTGVGVPT